MANQAEQTAELCDSVSDAGELVPSFIVAFLSLFLARDLADFEILRL